MVKYPILFLGLSISLFILVFLLRKRRKGTSDYLLISWFVIAFFHLTYYFLAFNYLLEGNHLIISIGYALPVFHILINALYLDSLRGKGLSRQLSLYASVQLIYLAIYYLLSKQGFLYPQGLSLAFSSAVPWWIYVIPVSHLVVYIIIGLYLLRSFRSYRVDLKAIYSNDMTTDVNWLGYWLWSYLFGSLIVLVGFILKNTESISVQNAYIIISAVISLQVFLAGQFGVGNYFTFTKASEEFTKYKSSGLKEAEKEKRRVQLLDHFNYEKPYLNPDLSLHQLAEMIKLPPYQLSQLINESLQTTFFELVNQYRIEEFKNRMKDHANSHLSILGIAMDSGFSSKSGFYKAFKKETGMSPSEYKSTL